MKWYLNFLITCSAMLQQCITGRLSWKSMYLAWIYFWNVGKSSVSSLIYSGLISLVSRFSCSSLKTQMNSFFFLHFMDCIRMLLLWQFYNMNMYLLPLLEVTGNLCLSKFFSWGIWSWWTPCFCVALVVSSGVLLVSWHIVAWWTCGSSLFVTRVPWMLPLMGVHFY